MSDSVGKISLDLEVKSELAKQIGAISSVIGKNLKASLEASTNTAFKGMKSNINSGLNSVTNGMKSTLSKMTTAIKSGLSGAFAVAKDIKLPSVKFPKMEVSKPIVNNVATAKATRGPPIDSEAIKTEMSNIENTMSTNENKIYALKDKLASLKEQYMQAFNPTVKNKLNDEILKTESSINRLITSTDKLGFKWADLNAKLSASGKGANSTASGVNDLNEKTKKVSNSSNAGSSGIKKLSNSFKSLGNSTKSTNNHLRDSQSQIGMIARSMFTWGIVFPMVIKGLGAMASGLLASLNTNSQFANSLAQIKTNLMVAFTPIFYAILPAINALMSTLATITTYIASFISAIFGKTYQQSFQATQGLIDAKEAMGAYGDSAKDTAKKLGALASFDEINTLNSSKDAGAGGGAGNSKVPKLVSPPVDTTAVDSAMKALVDRIKGIMGQVFQPFKEAWANEGQKTIDAMKYAWNGIKELIKSIGKSFLEVWTNGTGTKMLSTILQILQNVFKIIGDIANSFNNAWNSGNVGTTIIQNIFNILNNVLNVIKEISSNWINAWNDNGAGDKLASGVLVALENITSVLDDVTKGIGESFGKATESLFPAFIEFATKVANSISNLSDGFRIIWDNGGKVLFDGIVQLVSQVAELIMKLTSGVFADFADIFKNVLAPAIGSVFDAVGTVLKKLGEFIDWINSNQSVIEGLTTAVEAFMAAWAVGRILEFIEVSGGLVGAISSIGIAQTATNITTGILTILTTVWTGVCGIATIATTALGLAIDFLTSPIGLAIIAVTAIIAIGVLLYQNWDWLSQKATEVWEWIKEKFQGFNDWLGSVFSADWSQKFGAFGDIMNAFMATARDIWNSIKDVFSGVIDFVAGVFTGNWSRAWKGVVETLGGIFGGLEAIVKAPINGVIGLINMAISGLNSISVDIPDFVPGIGGEHFGIHIPKIPYLAKGGVINSPTLAMVGEAGKEAVMPLENNTGWITVLATKIAGLLGANSNNVSTAQQGGDIIFQIDGSIIGKVAIKELRKMQRQGGISVIPV